MPDPAAPFELATDSCGYGLGAVLLQHNKPVAFYSREMTDPEKNYVNHEQELLAAIPALKVFRCYLLGNHFNLITDNKPNTFLDTQPTLSRRQARWSEYLQRFHFTWIHKAGKFNVADPLSGNPSFKIASAVLAVTTRKQNKASETASKTPETASQPAAAPDTSSQKTTAKRKRTNTATPPAPTTAAKRMRRSADTETDVQDDAPDTVDIISRISEAYAADPDFDDDKQPRKWNYNEHLWWDGQQIVVPNDKEVKHLILHEFHDSAYAGHLGVRKTAKSILRYFTWPGIWTDTETFVECCPSCQINKGNNSKPKGLNAT